MDFYQQIDTSRIIVLIYSWVNDTVDRAYRLGEDLALTVFVAVLQ